MARSLDNLKAEFQLLSQDTSSGTIDTNQQTTLFNLAIRNLQATADVYGTTFESDLDLFSDEFQYRAPTNFKASIDLLDRDNPDQRFESRSEKYFWRQKNKEENIFADAHRRETFFLLVNADIKTGSILLHNLDSITANGTWAVVGGSGAINLTVDTFEFKEGSASLNFDATTATVPSIQNSTFTAVDLSSHQDRSTIFAWVFLPTITNLTNVILRWGSDTTNFFQQTVTSQFSGFPFEVGWNRLGFAWNGATTTGTPVASAIDFSRLIITYSVATTATDFRLDEIISKLPERIVHSYYTIPMVKDIAGLYKAEFTSGDDVTVTQDRHDELLIYYALFKYFMIMRQFDDATIYRGKYDELLKQVTSDHNSLRERQTDFYYGLQGNRLIRN